MFPFCFFSAFLVFGGVFSRVDWIYFDFKRRPNTLLLLVECCAYYLFSEIDSHGTKNWRSRQKVTPVRN